MVCVYVAGGHVEVCKGLQWYVCVYSVCLLFVCCGCIARSVSIVRAPLLLMYWILRASAPLGHNNISNATNIPHTHACHTHISMPHEHAHAIDLFLWRNTFSTAAHSNKVAIQVTRRRQEPERVSKPVCDHHTHRAPPKKKHWSKLRPEGAMGGGGGRNMSPIIWTSARIPVEASKSSLIFPAIREERDQGFCFPCFLGGL